MTSAARMPAPLSTTGIGSLPHLDTKPALRLAWSVDIPFLPELPRRDVSELFTSRAVRGLPGAREVLPGSVTIDLSEWEKGADLLDAALTREEVDLGEAWDAFVREIERLEPAFAKVQCAGPVTALALVSSCDPPLRLVDQAERLVIDRARVMVRSVRQAGPVPLLFLDEPMLGKVHNVEDLERLRGAIRSLKREGAIVGMHCCGDFAATSALDLDLDVLSFDAGLSLAGLLADRGRLERYLEGDGWLALGIVPTDLSEASESKRRMDAVLQSLGAVARPLRSRILSQSLLTPACGLGFHSVCDAGRVFDDVRIAQKILRGVARFS